MAESCDETCGSASCPPACGREAGAGPETCRLNRLGIGCVGSVVAVSGDSEQRRRLLEMGFCNGAQVQVIRRAPLGDPIEFRLRGYFLSLRDQEAGRVEVGSLRTSPRLNA
jgi:ferrous iron transport protein A